MPIYEYKCPNCDEEKEILQKLDEPPPKCCNIDMEKCVSLSSFQLKGSGWYKDGYTKGNKNDRSQKSK